MVFPLYQHFVFMSEIYPEQSNWLLKILVLVHYKGNFRYCKVITFLFFFSFLFSHSGEEYFFCRFFLKKDFLKTISTSKKHQIQERKWPYLAPVQWLVSKLQKNL